MSLVITDGREIPSRITLWGGIECTVNRVRDTYLDQMEMSGHANRIQDLDLFASLGIRAIRYPLLWERIAPNGLKNANWAWADERLDRLRELGIRVIAGLVHHGSGPRYTNLLDPRFPEKLAEFAAAVAERYPWLDAFTPVNEPLTTARFSGLYGLWYPHHFRGASFVRALFIQCRGIRLAMQAIRRVNPNAILVQTEDLGQTDSTPLLRYQARFENHRRWLTFDLLCGRVNPHHPLWKYFLSVGLRRDEIEQYTRESCPPDILGINYYVTSERYLDENLARFPKKVHGGNGRHAYADVEAVRISRKGIGGAAAMLRQAWERYHLPLAVTEAHLGCTREEQMRWFYEIWKDAQTLQAEGCDVRAVTAWSLLGSYNWHTMLTRDDQYYESGVFDLAGGSPRPTALAQMLSSLAANGTYDHPVLGLPGWWRRPERLAYHHPSHVTADTEGAVDYGQTDIAPPLLITGASGRLGRAFARLCAERGLPYRLLGHDALDITDPDSIEQALQQHQPWAVINAAGYVNVDNAERQAAVCFQINTQGAVLLAAACARRGLPLVTYSSDLVFNGKQSQPYVESDRVAPLSVYGSSKAQAETRVLEAYPAALVIRTSAFFGPWDESNFVTAALRALAAGKPFAAIEDITISPTYVPDLVEASLNLLMDREKGIWHLANVGEVTWFELARRSADMAGINARSLQPVPVASLGQLARRPRYSVLGCQQGYLLPPLDDALARYTQVYHSG